jgi:hypothetical protein
MRDTAYRIDFSGGLLTHRLQRVLILRDHEINPIMGYEKPRKRRNNGDYFGQMASWIDEVCFKLDRKNTREIAKLQRVVDDLLYLYANYEIKKKR